MLKQLKRILAVLLISTSAFADISTEAVTAHNKWRDMLNNGELKNQPRPAPFLSSMIWNQELADSATLHSQRCVWEHGSSGENLYAHTGHGGSMTHGVDLWANEYKNYDYQTNKSTGGMVGHYTQVVWARSVRVGCGKAYCPMIAKSDGSNMWGGTIYTCRYSQAGNYYGQRPYGTAGYKGDEFAKFNETNGDIEVPTITFNGHMYRLKMSKIGPWEKYYDFEFTAYEHLYASKRSNTSKLYADNSDVFKLVIEFETFTAYLTQMGLGTLQFRLTEIQSK